MIVITDKSLCCGCSACAQICPSQCIKMVADAEGFLYPKVDVLNCINCGLCETVCSFIDHSNEKKPLKTYAAMNPDTVERIRSSSGGMFSMLAREVINSGGVVWGAAFDEQWNVRHIKINKNEDLGLLQGSKYVQSIIGDCFQSIKSSLLKGEIVLFSGTACQVAGLKHFLRREYENLLTIDVVCHGVPSPMIWEDYVTHLRKNGIIAGIKFRDKQSGWSNYSFSVIYSNNQITSEPHNRNPFMKGYLHNLYSRPSCHNCKVKGGRCCSDISLGDYWGINKVVSNLNDNKGVSLVLVNTEVGIRFLHKVAPKLYETTYENAIQWNSCVEKSSPINHCRELFWDHYTHGEGLDKSVDFILSFQKPSIGERILRRIKGLLRKDQR